MAVVVKPSESFTMKLMGGKAFRAPSPTEMFGTNTWTLASNIEQLEPERITTADLAFDLKIAKMLNIRLNGFYTNTENIIAYSLGNQNLSTNIYSMENAGFETEIYFGTRTFSGFINTAYVQHISENIYEAEKEYVSEHSDRLTWVPAVTANLGLEYRKNKFFVSLLTHYQGKVERRDKDLYTQAEWEAMGLSSSPRENIVSDWLSFDARIGYVLNFFELGITARNLFDGDYYLVKNLKYPFDYKVEGRRVMLNMTVYF